ncbi:CidA/LrgA family protein [Herbaspirillum sp. alder98]|uniref:CidA/LrgA family protein n=1 Tax=Herbaspirillum sp. alder98 TaxID=2913096 RepID=UPI001CD838B2|nr:CidA/LrgA family protein [Herbaspirillum sp. alder98]MCA1324932.1 CidA/LrgA family protein [Herbaspirillum sp. alder98]
MNLTALAILLIFQCLGEGVAHLLGLTVPGPVIGMLLLLVSLLLYPRLADVVEKTSWGILQHLSLLFVPAGVGVMAAASQLQGDYAAILIALVVSTVLAIAVGALVTNWALKLQRRSQAPSEGQ